MNEQQRKRINEKGVDADQYGEFETVVRCLNLLEAEYRHLGVYTNRSSWLANLAKSLINWSALELQLRAWSLAEETFFEERTLLQQLGDGELILWLEDSVRLLVNQGILDLQQNGWTKAEKAFNDAEGSLQRLGITEHIQFELVGLHVCMKARVKAGLALCEAEKILQQLGTSEKNSLWKAYLAKLLVVRCGLDLAILEFKMAKTAHSNATNYYQILGEASPESPWHADIANRLIQSVIWHKRPQIGVDKLESTLAYLETLHHYPNDFARDLLNLSQMFFDWYEPDRRNPVQVLLFGVYEPARIAFFQRLAQLIERYDEQVKFDAQRSDWREIWHLWLKYALNQQDNYVLMALLAASYARRHQGLLQLNILQREGLDAGLSELVDLKKKVNELGFFLDAIARNVTDPESQTRYADQLAIYRDAQTTWHHCRERLIASGHYPDINHTTFNLRQLQLRLNKYEAILLCLSLADYGLDETPRLLLLSKICLVDLAAPDLQAVASTLNQINQLLQGCHSTLRKNNTDQAENEPSSLAEVPTLETLFADLQQTMNQTWQQLQPHLLDIRRLTVIGHGALNCLPWQGYAPDSLDVRQFSGFYALKRRADSNTYPDGNHLLAILAHADSENPHNHLYHLDAEVEMIQRIWGTERVTNIDQLKDAPDGSLLLLLGHGGHSQGRAWFAGPYEQIDQFQIALHPKPVHALCASSCLLGVTTDLNAEPLGMMSFAACRGDIHFSYGALAPVDDLLATCLSLLFHLAWRDLEDPVEAMRTALKQLKSGQWPAEARKVFEATYTAYLPALFRSLKADYRKAKTMPYRFAIVKRIERVLKDWHRNTSLRNASNILYGSKKGDPETAARILVAAMLNELTNQKENGRFKAKIEQFTRVWIWG